LKKKENQHHLSWDKLLVVYRYSKSPSASDSCMTNHIF
jgi:hypothetical protein